MAWTYEQNFNSLTDGDLNGQDSWSGSTNYDVQTSVVYEGAKALINSTNANADIQRDITATTSGTMYFAIRKGNNAAGLWSLLLRNTAGSAKWGLQMNSSGNIVLAGSTSVTILAGYSANTWYVIRIVYDAGAANSAHAEYNTGSGWSADSSSVSGVNTGDVGRIIISKDAATGSDYIDVITALNPFNKYIDVNDTLEISENITTPRIINTSVNDSIDVSENMTTGYVISFIVSETINIAENLSSYIKRVFTIVDNINISDVLSYFRTIWEDEPTVTTNWTDETHSTTNWTDE